MVVWLWLSGGDKLTGVPCCTAGSEAVVELELDAVGVTPRVVVVSPGALTV